MPLVVDEVDLLLNGFGELPSGQKKRKAVDSPYLHRLQRKHFVFFDVLPFFGTLFAIGLAVVHPIGWVEVGLFFAMWLLTGFGISVGFHRLFAHRTFRTTTPVRVALAVSGCMAGQGAPISWTAMHRRHHECTDKEGDMHSPNRHGRSFMQRVHGFIHAHYTWMVRHEYPNVGHYVPELLKDRALIRTGRLYRWWVLLGFAIPAVAGGLLTQSWMGVLTGFLWGGVVRMFVVGHSMWALNSFLHTVGRQPFPLRENMLDNSRNSGLLALISWGEGWHNNHHAFPYSASFGLAWYRVDPGYWLIRTLEMLGLAHDVLVPTAARIAARSAGVSRLAN